MNKDLLIITIPFIYTLGPSLAPALLKACVEKDGLTADAWDLSADFNYYFENHVHYNTVLTWFKNPEIKPNADAFAWYQDIIKQYAKSIIEKNARVVGLSILTQNSQRFAEDLCFHIKLINPEQLITLGGPGVHILQFQYHKFWSELMVDSGLADSVIIGEGETSLTKVIKENIKGLYFQSQLSNDELSAIPVPDYSDYDLSLYKESDKSYWSTFLKSRHTDKSPIFSITSSKGCVRNCTFCDVGKLWNKFKYRSGKSVANEMLTLNKLYGATFFSFTDSLLNGGLKPFYEMNQALVDSGNKDIRYEGQMICRSQQDMPEKYFKAMAEAGCSGVFVGIESGSERVRAEMGKGSTNDDIHYSTEMFIKYGIKQSWNIIPGYPTETDRDWQDTLDLINTWYPKANGLLTILPISPFLMLPGTPITETELSDQYGIEQEIVNGYSDFSWTAKINPSNTFKVRASRYIELCNTLIKLTDDQTFKSRLSSRIDEINKQLSWYYEHKKLSN